MTFFARRSTRARSLVAAAVVIGSAIASVSTTTSFASDHPAGTLSASAAPSAAAPAARLSSQVRLGPSGQSMPTGDLPGWRQIFSDDFTTNVPVGSFPAAVSSKWGAYPNPWPDTKGFGTYAPGKVVSVANGVLTKHLHTEPGGRPQVAALTPKLTGTGQNGVLYGRFAMRFRADSLPGYKVAWLLWPDSNDHTRDGEIDFPETNLDKPYMFAFMHRTNATSSADQASFQIPANLSQWHTAVFQWSPNLVVFFLDGVEVGRTAERVPNVPMHWVLQTETAMDLTAPPSPTVAGDVQLDWVAAWAYDPSTADTTPPSVSAMAPTHGSTVSGPAVNISAAASDAKGVLGVQFKIDGMNLGVEDVTPPYTANLNTLLLANGAHTVTAHARDDAGNVGTATSALNVGNVADTTAPSFTPNPCLSGCTVFPQDKANVLVSFNEPVTGVDGTSFTLKNKATGVEFPAVVSYASTLTSAIATLDPTGVLLPDTKYTATLTSAIKDIAGNPITTTSWTFLTGPRPTLTHTPAHLSVGLPRAGVITATFDEPIQGVSANFVLKTTAAGTPVPATVTYDAATRKATLRPTSPLRPGGTYTASINANVKDIAGNAVNPISWTFTVGP